MKSSRRLLKESNQPAIYETKRGDSEGEAPLKWAEP
jgi:hypothetical protein